MLLSGGWAAMINVGNVLMYLAYDNVFMATNLLDFFFGLGRFVMRKFIPALSRLSEELQIIKGNSHSSRSL